MTIQELYLYPIKSLSGIKVNSATLDARGFEYDRRWMVVDEDGVFISQRKYPVLASIQVALKGELLHLYTQNDPTGTHIPLAPENGQSRLQVKVWDFVCNAVDGFDAANIWLSQQLSMKCRLVYMPKDIKRWIKNPKVPKGSILSFADGYPYLIIGSASLAHLNKKLDEPISMRRFRPNIVVHTNVPHEEDLWQSIGTGHSTFKLIKSCKRCIMVNVDPLTSITHKEPLRTLSSYRMKDNKVHFGMNAIWIPKYQDEVIRVGDCCVGV